MPGLPVDEVIVVLEAIASTKYLAIASFTVLIYDHLICLGQESEFFWKGEWTLTRVLYFVNRYIPPVIFILHLAYIMSPGTSTDVSTTFCGSSYLSHHRRCFYITNEVLYSSRENIGFVSRIWFARRRSHFDDAVFAAGTTVSVVFAAIVIHKLNAIRFPSVFNVSGCVNAGKGPYWPIFAPTCVVQTVLFLATVFRIRSSIASGKNEVVTTRLLRDGGIFYCAVLASVAFAMFGSLMENHPRVVMPALLSNYLLAVHSICASHLILSIHSLAADVGSDPVFLLSNIEISRIVWRKGENENELIVDLGDCDSCPSLPMELLDLDPLGKEEDDIQVVPHLRSTRIGMLHRNNSQVDLAARAPSRYRPGSSGTT